MASTTGAGPIQVVINADGYVADWQRQPGGRNKDFFAERDADFAEHRQAVLRQVNDTRDVLLRDGQPGVGFLKVSMRTEALAKSHRPVRALFSPERAPVVGAGAQGELIVAVTPAALDEIATRVANAESQTKFTKKDNKHPDVLVPNPSRPRSEIGAIDKLALWNATDRRHYSAQEAVEWLSDPRTGGFYLVELFLAPTSAGNSDLLDPAQRALFASFREALINLGNVRAVRVNLLNPHQVLMAVWLLEGDDPAEVTFQAPRSLDRAHDGTIDLTLARHQQLLQSLDHPLVKRIHLPPIVETRAAAAQLVGAPSGAPIVPSRDKDASYPRVAVIDGGIGPCLEDWVVARWPFVAEKDESLDHATFIGGLLVAGRSMNAEGVARDPDGCELIDVKLLPNEADTESFARYYGVNGPLGFFQELNDAVASLRERHGVRIFNLSANFQTMADPARYNPLTAELDSIADTHDVLFVLSAGNADGLDCREEWPEDPVAAMATLAAATQDRVCSPAESIRSISVGALNPPHLTHVVAHAPAAYSRRGPGLKGGLKPDVAEVGGARTLLENDSGLWSLHPDGHVYSAAGTSYAAPLVAKTLACLAHGIEGEVSRETLMALLLHHSRLPASLSNPDFGQVARYLVGFGLPAVAEDVLEGSAHQITMLFSGRARNGRRLEFTFPWPSSLTSEGGKCRGFAQMTLVATPPIDPRAESELVRVDVQAHLNQEGIGGGHASSGWLPTQPGKRHHREVRLIADDMKWSPVKIYQWRSKEGVGKSTDWKLMVDHLSRDETSMPPDGVPFSLLLTIGDLDGVAPIFQEVRQTLLTRGVQLEQIQTAARVSARV